MKAMQASPQVPNPEKLRQAKVMSESLMKKIEVEGDGSKIEEQVSKFQEFKFREFRITKGTIEKFGHSDNCQGCEAAASGTDAMRHIDDCRQRMEQLILDDVLGVRLVTRHASPNRDAECEKHKRPRIELRQRRSRTMTTSGDDDCSCWRQKRNSWTCFLKGTSTVRRNTI